MDEASGPERSRALPKTRRPHRKSKHGCTRCKERRIKCDEITPRCTRCNRLNLTCEYPTRQPGPLGSEDCLRELKDSLLPLPDSSRTDCKGASPESPGYSSALPGSPGSTASTDPSAPSLPVFSRHGGRLDSPLRSHAAQTLAPAEFELLNHYLEHTSMDMTVDDEDRYTLQIGIPSLACQSRPLMRSVLALAAVCECSDIINRPSVAHKDRGQVLELLSLAHGYHMESLREIQATLPEAEQYDHVLANAAMMGMYGSGSQCIRIWLAKTATFRDQPLGDLMPNHSQWISLFRAVHVAYTGLLSNVEGKDDTSRLGPTGSSVESTTSGGPQLQYGYNVTSRVEPPAAPPIHVLSHILTATVGSALASLVEKATVIAKMQADNTPSGYDDSKTPTAHGDPKLQACFTALAIFSNIVTETIPADKSMPSTASKSHLDFKVDISPIGHLSKVSPWLRRYTASITSMIPSRLPRRIIMAFIHKVPTSYLNLVEEMVSLMQSEAPDGDDAEWDSSACIAQEPSLAHQFALEIFAHWLVLVILLDNVWWIGGIGAWELKRIVASRKDLRWRTCLWNKKQDWWPESMFEISRQFDKHRS